MNSLPAELIIHIAGCDLSLPFQLCIISKRFHAICQPLLYRAITAFGSDKLSQVAEHLSANPGRAAFVRHLCLSDEVGPNPDDPDDMRVFVTKIISGFNVIPFLPDTSPNAVNYSQKVARALPHLCTILTLTAPHLYSLHYIIYLGARSGYTLVEALFSYSFPSLRELTLRRGAEFRVPESIQMPNLRRLHVCAGSTIQGSFTAFAAACPGLTHLRVHQPSNLLCGSIVAMLLQECARPVSSINEKASSAEAIITPSLHLSYLPNLRHFIIETDHPAATFETNCHPLLFSLAQHVKQLTVVPAQPWMQTEVPEVRHSYAYPHSLARRNWMLNVEGQDDGDVWEVGNALFRPDLLDTPVLITGQYLNVLIHGLM